MHIHSPEDASKPLDQIPLGRGILPPQAGQSILEWIAWVEQNYGAEFVGCEDHQGHLHGIEDIRRIEQARMNLEASGHRPMENLPALLGRLRETDEAMAAFNQIEGQKRVDEIISRMRAEQEKADGEQGIAEK